LAAVGRAASLGSGWRIVVRWGSESVRSSQTTSRLPSFYCAA
jgi:hypothetical protein